MPPRNTNLSSACSSHIEQDVSSGFRRAVDEICALLGCYVVSSGNFLPTFRELLRKTAKELPLLAPQ